MQFEYNSVLLQHDIARDFEVKIQTRASRPVCLLWYKTSVYFICHTFLGNSGNIWLESCPNWIWSNANSTKFVPDFLIYLVIHQFFGPFSCMVEENQLEVRFVLHVDIGSLLTATPYTLFFSIVDIGKQHGFVQSVIRRQHLENLYWTGRSL